MESKRLEQAARIGLVYLLILMLGSLYFYRERIFSDEAFISFLIINSGKLQIQVERYGSFITQMFPLGASLARWPIKVVMLFYSLSFNLFYFLTGLLLFYKFKEFGLTIILAFYFSLLVSDNYFWTNIELHQGVAWMMLMLGFIRHRGRIAPSQKIVLHYSGTLLVFALLAFIAIYSHPAVIIPLSFLWGFFWIKEGKQFLGGKSLRILCSAIILAILFFKIKTSATNGYDGSFITRLAGTNLQAILDTFSSGLADIFWKGLLRNYWLLMILFVGSIVSLIVFKKWILLAWTLAGNLGFFVLLCLSFSDGTVAYLEGEFMPFAILGTAAAVYYGFPRIQKAQLISTVMILIFCVRLVYIGFSSDKFRQRLAKVNSILKYMEDRKVNKMIIVKNDNRLEDELIMGWGLPCETLINSLINGDEIPKTCIYINPDQIKAYSPPDVRKDFYGPFRAMQLAEINRFYFNYDTTRMYEPVTYEQVFDIQ